MYQNKENEKKNAHAFFSIIVAYDYSLSGVNFGPEGGEN